MCLESKNIEEVLKDDDWIITVEEELYQFTKNNVWKLVPKLEHKSIIGTRWVFRNKLDKNGYNQQEGIGFTETFVAIAILEAIRIMLAFVAYKDIKAFQMDVKSAFLNGLTKEEVFVKQPLGFKNTKHLNHVFKLKKVLYGLKQAPCAWYDKLSSFLISNGFSREEVDTTLFRKEENKDFILVQIYNFFDFMQSKFEMSMMGELKFFLRLQVKQEDKDILSIPLTLNRKKSTSGGCHFIESCLVSWACKKQISIALSIAKVKYISAISCCPQHLGIQIINGLYICTKPLFEERFAFIRENLNMHSLIDA
ncbi:Copia protein, partial [Mucuna pruriens]